MSGRPCTPSASGAGVDIELTESVDYRGTQDLRIAGSGNIISGAGGDPAANTTWNSGLVVSHSAAALTISRLHLVDSFNNGVAVFVPADASQTVRVQLVGSTIEGAKFHGLFVDGQSSSGYNTDDVPHLACTDPHAVDSDASLDVRIRLSSIVGNGTLAGGYDDSVASGCPRDFDGVRVDEGGRGDLRARLQHSEFRNNLADGVELDETGDGGVAAQVEGSSFDANGESGETADGLTDLDDGFDIDEAGAGSVTARVVRSTASDNRDEGFDFDEAGGGGVDATFHLIIANANEDEGVKIDEEDEGSLRWRMSSSSTSGSLSQDGVDLTEAGAGDFSGRVEASIISGNDGAGINAAQEDDGTGRLRVVASDLSANAGASIDVDGISVETVDITE